MFYKNKTFTKQTVNNLLDAATLIFTGQAKDSQALHYQYNGKDFYFVPDGTSKKPFFKVAVLKKKNNLFFEIDSIGIWMDTKNLLALNFYRAIKETPIIEKRTTLILS